MPDALAPDPFTAMAAQLTPKRAVSYIRVSTREQAQRGGSEEGFSLPAQRIVVIRHRWLGLHGNQFCHLGKK